MIASDEAMSAGLGKRMQLRMHLAMCRHCSKFARQLRDVKQAVKEAGAALSDAEIAEVRARVLGRLLEQ